MANESQHTLYIIVISCIATIGGFLFGFDSGVINGTVDGLQTAFDSDSVGTGFNVASMLLGCAAGAFFAGRLADRFGKGLRGAPRDAVIARVVDRDHRGLAFGLHRSMDHAGALLGPLLAAALLPASRWLAGRGITEVHYFSVLRGNRPVTGKPRSQHDVGLAIDILALGTPGAMDKVEAHFPRGRLRDCARVPNRPRGRANDYMALTCALHRNGWAHTVLTPDYDHAHHDHLHVDIKAERNADARAFVSLAR